MNILRISILLLGIVLSNAFAQNTTPFSSKNVPHLPSKNIIQFEDGRDYFSYEQPILLPKRLDNKIPILFFFNYDCRVCSIAHDIVLLYSQLNHDTVVLEEYPVATNEDFLSANIFLSLKKLDQHNISDLLLFESADKKRYVELSYYDNLLNWLKGKNIEPQTFTNLFYSKEVKQQIKEIIQLTEDYGVFTYPYVIIDGKYVLTASTLYNDDYSFAVLNFLLKKIQQGKK
ncbi:thiol:disulfide interchange protein DsbA [Bisgaardia hudsonensis]|uniref:Thiol:disulfide interchange protein DsbA n=1 Tax=Bisgaardia hudsonensis TaxID=109472 RepID=A0A4R2N2P8_9PAST|nr:thiol:disulfide interchange protein DsbA/DsbL [Bisgaardia hudsonensis]QLB12548.1 hypothetical protein A6A11_02480 [Bisgaardia hudsonensis]TCP14089.1 thiol:disulfide interchange protein DsbA [Bisgaardia hudsonensis]